jgi:hypothetical protein
VKTGRDAVVEAIEVERQRLEAEAAAANAARKEAILTYVTPRVIAMAMPSATPQPGENAMSEVAEVLEAKHRGRYMVWNLSERTYDTAPFGHQVIEYSFPLSPIPPLGTCFEIAKSIEGWLLADGRNVAVVHPVRLVPARSVLYPSGVSSPSPLHPHDDVVHSVRNCVLSLQINPRRAVADAIREVRNRIGVERCGKEAHLKAVRPDALRALRQGVKDCHQAAHRIAVAHEAISLVHDEEAHLPALQLLRFDKVRDSRWRTNDDVRAALQLLHRLARVDPSH